MSKSKYGDGWTTVAGGWEDVTCAGNDGLLGKWQEIEINIHGSCVPPEFTRTLETLV